MGDLREALDVFPDCVHENSISTLREQEPGEWRMVCEMLMRDGDAYCLDEGPRITEREIVSGWRLLGVGWT